MKSVAIMAIVLASVTCVGPVDAQETRGVTISRAGTRETSVAPAPNFTGAARVETLFGPTPATRAYAASVAFAARARTAWHTHALGQVLIVTAGVGRVQRWGETVQEIRTGDVVRIAAGVKHWHGAAPATAMTHIAIVEQGDGASTQWMEPVSDAQFDSPMRAAAQDASPSAESSRAQQLMGDVAPKLATLTDSVLLGDVWGRPGLSRRDRSLATVSALIAMNRPDQLRSHLALALQNGVTQEELVETITQMAFYAGWPNAITAVGVARDVFRAKR
ncbi:MAG: carboxymuconolactone decarboxylase family protein [Gemmatimonadota bacterium]